MTFSKVPNRANLKYRLSILAIVPLLMGVAPTRCEFQGPTRHYMGLDTNSNKVISLKEWMVYYGPHEHDWSKCWGNDFISADCNSDRQL